VLLLYCEIHVDVCNFNDTTLCYFDLLLYILLLLLLAVLFITIIVFLSCYCLKLLTLCSD